MLISDKERLEEIAENTYIHVHLDKETTAELPKHHFEYLYEQTERVTELEEEYQGIIDKATSERLDFLEQQNKRYREAIERALREGAYGDCDNAIDKMYGILGEALESEPNE